MYGGTGVGKSQFVNDATGRPDMSVGHDLRSCTQKVAASQPFVLDGQNIVLFDTPGFDDTTMSDADTLKRIAEFLESMYRRGMKLKGLVYMHRITDMRMAGASARTYRLLRNLCGTANLSNVVICTNMWSNPPTEDELRREAQLETEFFKVALENGAKMVRRPSLGMETAHDVLRVLLPKAPTVLEVTSDVVDRGMRLQDTEAGKFVEAELRFKLAKQEQELQELKHEIANSLAENDLKFRNELEKFRAKKESDMSTLSRQLASLGVEVEEGRRFWESQFEDMRARRVQAMRLTDEQGKFLNLESSWS
ncbi:50S ribosome-binding GTPase [Ceratobasidium sp. AG-Ba]|nr:50S ribosome-binding GTPase [Ceratobasidium sp. AG-Ba]QRW08668.1 50S ribosome-binding GTPase [Ceratobasidium sp. AG-Ba]